MQIFLIRHGQSENNQLSNSTDDATWNSTRATDPRLTPTGIKQAELLAKWLRDEPHDVVPPTHLYCSFMHRAAHTASIVAEAAGMQPTPLSDLCEVGRVWRQAADGSKAPAEPTPLAQLTSELPSLKIDKEEARAWYTPAEEYESDAMAIARIDNIARRLLTSHDENSVLWLVAHGAFNTVFMQSLVSRHLVEVARDSKDSQTVNERQSETPPWWPWHFALANTSVSKLNLHVVGGGQPRHVEVTFSNRIGHLPADLVTT